MTQARPSSGDGQPATSRRLARSAVSVLVWTVVATSAAFLVAVGIAPRVFGYRTATVLSASMGPAIPAGSVVVLVRQRPRDIRVGQVVTYQVPVGDHQVVSHRVTEVVSGGDHPVFRTKGDANAADDAWTAQVSGDTVWRVGYAVPKLGWAISWLRQPPLHTATVRVLPFVLAAIWLVGIWRPSPSDPAAAGAA